MAIVAGGYLVSVGWFNAIFNTVSIGVNERSFAPIQVREDIRLRYILTLRDRKKV